MAMNQWKEALTKIQSAHRSERTRLTLSYDELESLPTELGDLTSLEALELYECNSLLNVPSSIGRLGNSLTELHFNECSRLTSLPLELGELKSLKRLSIRYCHGLKVVPEVVCRLQDLEELELCGFNSVSSLPPEIGALSNLKRILLGSCNSLIAVFPTLGKLRNNLTKLQIQLCRRLTSLPPELGELLELAELTIRGCSRFEILPPSIGRLSKLRALCLDSCPRIARLPHEVAALPQLTSLHLGNCPSVAGLPIDDGAFIHLEQLHIIQCPSIRSIQLGSMKNLEEMHILGCGRPDLPNELASLECLASLSIDYLSQTGHEWGVLAKLPEGLRILDLSFSKVFREWNQLIAAELPPRLRVLRLASTPLAELPLRRWDADVEDRKQKLTILLQKNPYLRDLGRMHYRFDYCGLEHELAINRFRPVLPGGHLYLPANHLPLLVAEANDRLSPYPSTQASALFSLIRDRTWWDCGAVH